jgi:hypothetical protein
MSAATATATAKDIGKYSSAAAAAVCCQGEGRVSDETPAVVF